MNKNKSADWWCQGKRYPGAVKVVALIATRLGLAQAGVKLTPKFRVLPRESR